MRIMVVLHADFESPGAIGDWASQRGHILNTCSPYKGDSIPAATSFDMLIIMGGPQSPLKLEQYPYLRDEITLAKSAIQEKKPMLGICLGSQLIGEALGARTERSPNREIGAYPVMLTEGGSDDPIFRQFPPHFEVMHWHNDMPGLSAGATLLAYSEGCPRQAVRYTDRVYGLQFHIEMTPADIKGMISHCVGDLKPGQYVYDKSQLLAIDTHEMNRKLFIILDYLASHATHPSHASVKA